MPLAATDLAALVEIVAQEPAAGRVAALRARFPGLTISQCDARDLDGDEAFQRFADVDLHWVDGRDHCWRLTVITAEATGLLLAVKGGCADERR